MGEESSSWERKIPGSHEELQSQAEGRAGVADQVRGLGCPFQLIVGVEKTHSCGWEAVYEAIDDNDDDDDDDNDDGNDDDDYDDDKKDNGVGFSDDDGDDDGDGYENDDDDDDDNDDDDDYDDAMTMMRIMVTVPVLTLTVTTMMMMTTKTKTTSFQVGLELFEPYTRFRSISMQQEERNVQESEEEPQESRRRVQERRVCKHGRRQQLFRSRHKGSYHHACVVPRREASGGLRERCSVPTNSALHSDEVRGEFPAL